jgi:tetratricopeptide (TPR) repeat protein
MIPLLVASPRPATASRVDDAKQHIFRLRYDIAENELIAVAKSTEGDDRQEALYLLAGLKKSASEAQIIYEEIIRVDGKNRWARRAEIELAKIQYALGRYEAAQGILESSSACEHYDEACYFQGLAAAQLKRYDSAKSILSMIKRGRYQPWAFLSLAEIDMKTSDPEAACRRYKAMARSGISPVAMYRYGECLEKKGDMKDAADAYRRITKQFQNTPEAVLAQEKIDLLARKPLAAQKPGDDPGDVLTSGFTIQFGAFQDRRNAITLAAQLRRQLPSVRIDSDLINFKEIHRVRFGYFGTREEAQARAGQISTETGEPCTIMTLP